jgi:hypothetical protein
MHKRLLPPTLAEIGYRLWGARWMEPMAAALAVSEREIVQWDAKPAMMPPNVEERIRIAAEMRLHEIEDVIARLDDTGVRARDPDAIGRVQHPAAQIDGHP